MFVRADIINNLRLAKKLRSHGFEVYCPNETTSINDKTRNDITSEKIYCVTSQSKIHSEKGGGKHYGKQRNLVRDKKEKEAITEEKQDEDGKKRALTKPGREISQTKFSYMWNLVLSQIG